MPYDPNRRQVLASTLALAAGGIGLLAPAGGRATPTTPLLSLVAERRILDVNGRAASVFGIRGPDSMAGLTLDPGQIFRVEVLNRMGEDTVIHWHGQTPPNVQDGVVETGTPLVRAGSRQLYDFVPRPGTHWMHSHHGLQEQQLMAAPLIVRTADDQRADMQEVIVLLHDFSFQDPTELFAQVTKPDASMPGMATGGPDLNDINYDAYLANDRTLDDPQVVRTERNGRVRLRIINGATSTAFWIDLGSAKATVLAVDGNTVQPIIGSRFPLAQGQRLDLLVEVPAGGAVPVLAQREGDRTRTGIILGAPGATVPRIGGQAEAAALPADLSLEQRLVAATPLSPRVADVTHRVALTGTMMPYAWTLDGRDWAGHRPLRVAGGQRVVLEMVNRSPMAHPMHLHGHHFQVTALDGKPVNGALRDTVLVPVEGSVTVAFDADNPGRWLFHCHNLLHMAAGMMTELDYGGSA